MADPDKLNLGQMLDGTSREPGKFIEHNLSRFQRYLRPIIEAAGIETPELIEGGTDGDSN